MDRKHYLITGGTGFIGSALVRRLVSAGHRVRVLDDNSRGRASRLEEIASQVEMIVADIRDAETVRTAARGVTTICHLAFINGTELFYETPDAVLEVGSKGMLNVLDAIAAEGVPELCLVSSSEVYQTPPTVPTDESAPYFIPDPLNPRYSYAGAKIISELLALNHRRSALRRLTIVRPHNVYGPDMGSEHVIPQFALRLKRLLQQHGRDEAIPFEIQGNGDESRAFVYIDDFIEGMLAVLEKGEHRAIYHVGTEREERIRHIAEMVASVAGTSIVIKPGLPAIGGTARRCPDTRKVRALGYNPVMSLEDGIHKTVTWYFNAPTLPASSTTSEDGRGAKEGEYARKVTDRHPRSPR